MKTTTINPKNESNSDKKKNIATHGATAAAAAGLGVAGAMAMDSEQEVSPISVDEHKESADATPQPHTSQSSPSAATQNNTSATNSTSNDTANPILSDEPQPITGVEGAEENIAEETVEAGTDNINDSEDVAEIDESELSEIENEIDESLAQDTSNNSGLEETVNPDEVAEAIIAEDQVDPNDIDMADVFSFDEIGTVYTVDGESYTAAAFHDAAGNQLVMVDVDGDDVFDIITDVDGTPLIDQNGNVATAGNLTVDDVEIGMSPDPTYLASNDTDSLDDFGEDSILNDMIS